MQTNPLVLFSILLTGLAHPGLAADFTSVADCPAPGGKLRVEVGTDASGHLAWRLEALGRPLIGVSQAGVVVEGADSGSLAKVGKPLRRGIDKTFAWRGPDKQRREHCQVAEFPVVSNGQKWTFEVRAFDDGAAYRCRIPGQGQRHVTGEAATFVLPASAICYANPNTAAYEGIHMRAAVEKLEAKEGIGMPLTIELPGGGFAAITEAQSMGWSGMTLEASGTTTVRGSFRDDPKGWDITGEITTPWRVVTVAANLDGLVHAPLVDALCPAPDPALFPQGLHTGWIKPGRCLWQWWAFDAAGTHWTKQKDLVDKAAALACQYYLVDEGWEHSRQDWFKPGDPDGAWPRMKELCAYAKTKGVGIWVWRGWTLNPGAQWPGLETHDKRADFFRRCREAGVAGAKIDFMDSESHERLEFYQDCLKVAAECQIMVNFHGANKPAGEARTWPNEMTREGIRGLEYNKWAANPPDHYATLPFTRLLAGHADFTPTTFNPKFLKGTTVAQQLACAVVLSSPFLCWADSPDLYLASPAVDAIRTMPVLWDETRVLAPSAIGDLAAIARRNGDEWWVGVVNGGGQRGIELALGFLGAGNWTADRYADGEQAEEFAITRGVAVSPAVPHKVALAAGGGLVLHLRRK